jgi:CrcB protein
MSSTSANGEPKNEQGNASDSSAEVSREDVMPVHRQLSVRASLARHEHVEDAQSLASIDRPPEEELPLQQIYHPLSLHVLALLAPASILGLLARLGLLALTTYDGQSIFPLAYVQSVGCLLMGIGIGLKEPIGR